MNIVDQFHVVETVGDLKKAMAECDDIAKITASFSPNGLGAKLQKHAQWKELYLRVRKVATSLGKTKPVEIIAGEIFSELEEGPALSIEDVHDEAAFEKLDLYFLKQRVMYHAGMLPESEIKRLETGMAGSLGSWRWELDKSDWQAIYKLLAFEGDITPENSQN